jgi:5-methylcytosine-specific restriction endonuclease McrA
MPRAKTGVFTTCPSCQNIYYRQQHNIRNNTQLTCSIKCSAISRIGEGNHYWGKKHTPETRATISAAVRANPSVGTGPKKGYKHTPEARAKMTAALTERWRLKRQSMMEFCSSGQNQPYKDIVNEPRYRFIFTKTQKREWTEAICSWCPAVSDLVLDHIIPVICGGINIKANAQTLCQDCNRWKMKHVDRPLYHAILGHKRG